METHRTPRPGKKTALRAVLAGSWLLAAACTGVEGEVLTLRAVTDLAADAGRGPGPDGGVASCTAQTLSTSGCVDLTAWRPKAQAVCSSLGLVLGQVALTTACPMNTGQGVRFDCCPAPVCTPALQGDAMSCREAKDLLDSAAADCQSRSQQASLLALVEPCAMWPMGRYRMVKYMCCSAPPIPSTMP